MIVAIPAYNEADRIVDCLGALATQREHSGAPLTSGSFAVLVLANNCDDGTDEVVRNLAAVVPFTLELVVRRLPPSECNAGAARKIAMDLAGDLLRRQGAANGIILTTDADSTVCSTWVARTRDAIATGADAVAGYIEGEPTELLRLGPAFLARGRLEDRYLAQMAEIDALGDPRLHDPWPNHRVSSGASLAVTLAAYDAIGGLPVRPVGEDAALSTALRLAGYRIRHATDITVTTSCRFDGRAQGGAADTMKLRHEQPDAPCDDDMEPSRRVARRALWRGSLRRWFAKRPGESAGWERRLDVEPGHLDVLAAQATNFETFWQLVEGMSGRLARLPALRPSQLPAEIERADAIIRRLRHRTAQWRFRESLVPQSPGADPVSGLLEGLEA